MRSRAIDLDRRDFLARTGSGIGALALSTLDAGCQSNHPAKANRVIQIFCSGGLSHVDTYDYKPELALRAGKPFDPEGKLQFMAFRLAIFEIPKRLKSVEPPTKAAALLPYSDPDIAFRENGQ
jgi:hypothetical protein